MAEVVEKPKSSIEGVTGPDVKGKLEFENLREFTVQLDRGMLFVTLGDGTHVEYDLTRVSDFTTSNKAEGFTIQVKRKPDPVPEPVPAPVSESKPTSTSAPAKK